MFKDHFIIRKGNLQNDDDIDASIDLEKLSLEDKICPSQSDHKNPINAAPLKWEPNEIQHDPSGPLLPSSSVSCAAPQITPYSCLNDINQQQKVNSIREDKFVETLLSSSQNEPNIVSIPSVSRSLLSSSKAGIGKDECSEASLSPSVPTRKKSCIHFESLDPISFSPDSLPIKNSGGRQKPNVYRSTLANGAIPLFPLPLMNQVHRDGIIDEKNLEHQKAIDDLIPTGDQPDLLKSSVGPPKANDASMGVPNTSVYIPLRCQSSVPGYEINSSHTCDGERRPITSQVAGWTAVNRTYDEVQIDSVIRNCSDDSQDKRLVYNKSTFSHSLSQIPDPKPLETTTVNPTRPAKSFLPFPVGKSSSDNSEITNRNRFLATDIKPLKPLGKNPRMIQGNSSVHGSDAKLRIAPSLDFDDRRLQLSNSSLGGVFGHSSGPQLGLKSKLASSPMEKNYPMISRYLQSSELNFDHKIKHSDSESAILEICGQRLPIPMNLIFSGLQNLEKVGEGVFGEVFLGYFICKTDSMRVYKIVAIEGSEFVNGEKQKTFSEILPEIIISKEVSKLHDGYRKCFTDGFIKMHNARITVGCYPETLVQSWKKWNEVHDSDNDCPNFKMDQLYIVFEYDHGGEDVESYKFENARQTFFLTLQVAYILAVGECAMEFEHRDLHWGNVLVEKTESKEITFHLNGKTHTVPSLGVKACIIDFTISRIVDGNKRAVFLDMKDDEEQFLGTGDHQFDIYRMMRDCNRNNWSPFFPKTNTFWIHYLAEKLFNKARYVDTFSDTHIFFMRQLRQLKDVVMEYESCTEFALSPTCERFKQLKVDRRRSSWT